MIRILKDITFNETEIAIFINIRNLSQKIITLTTSNEIIEITKIIENAPNINDKDIANANDINIIFENAENALFKNIIIESAPLRRSTWYRKAISKTIKTNAVKTNTIEIAETSTIFTDEKESEKEDYLSKTIITKLITANEDKLTCEKIIINLKKS
jgi:hypothetical protein